MNQQTGIGRFHFKFSWQRGAFSAGIALIPVDTQFPGNLANPIQQPAMIEHCIIPMWLDLRMGGNGAVFSTLV
ncbi:MAG: hypothetical protein E6Q59_05700 [Nitrosomonas sp.]|nr:MAG: hypothetical protein E6Q59_05700 [Nitrosomonas sp.]